MRRNQFHQKRSLGQVFLKVDWPVRRLVEKLHQWNVRRVMEIGPGAGILTRALAEGKWDLTVVEKDDRFAEKLREEAWRMSTLGASSFEVVGQDFLKFDLDEWLGRTHEPTAIVGNIPYNISTPILMRILPILGSIKGSLLMTQLEFAKRLSGRPQTRDYGSISVFTQLRALPSIEYVVPRTCFKPVPKVDSAVVALQKLSSGYGETELKRAEWIARAAFSQRRKKLRNSISQYLDADKEAGSPIDLERRAETLSPQEFLRLGEYLAPNEEEEQGSENRRGR